MHAHTFQSSRVYVLRMLLLVAALPFSSSRNLDQWPAKCWTEVPGGFKGNYVYEAALATLGRDGATFVEIGSLLGQSTCYMAHLLLANPMLRLNFDVIDYWARLDESAKDVAVSWMPTPQYAEAQRWGKGEMSMAWRYFMQKTGSWDAIRHVRHGSSIDPAVAQRYADNSIDFIYLDTAHDAALTRAELAIWWPKVKESGGWLCGDDYHGGMRKKRLRRESMHSFVSARKFQPKQQASMRISEHSCGLCVG